MTSKQAPITASHTPAGIPRTRTSEVLRGILSKNPGVKTFTVERILDAIGPDRVEASLVMFSIPSIMPVPGTDQLSPLPTAAIAGQFMIGRTHIRLPQFVLRRTVSRRSLAVAIHAMLPLVEAAEKVVRPRWSWVTHPLARRAIGLLVFLLAASIAYPLSGFGALHASSIAAVALGMAEQDGLAVMIGLVAGALSLAIVAASSVSLRALRIQVRTVLRKLTRKLGLRAFANYLERLGFTRLAAVLRFQWTELLLEWDPERNGQGRHGPATTSVPSLPPPVARADQALPFASGSKELVRSRRTRLRSVTLTRLESSLAWRA